MASLYLWLYGGYGDCIVAYIHGGLGLENRITPSKCGKGSMYWDKLRSIKELHPEITTRAIVMSGNPMTAQLALRNPYIDETIKLPTLNGVNTVSHKVKNNILKHITDHVDIDFFVESNPNRRLFKSIKNSMYLTNFEQEKFDILKEKLTNKYVVIHPFASIKTRMPVSSDQYIKLAEKIYNKTGMKTIIVGGSFSKKRMLDSGQFLNDKRIEEFDYESDGVLNNVNKSSMIIDTKLVRGAAAVVGSWSCHTTTALSLGIPTTVYTTHKAFHYFDKIMNKKFKRGLAVNKTFLTNSITNKVSDDTISFLTEKLK